MSDNKKDNSIYEVTHQVSGTPFVIKHTASSNNDRNVKEVVKNNQDDEFKYEVTHQVSDTPFIIKHSSGKRR